MKKIIVFFIFITAVFVSCNDAFLEKYPVTSLTEETAFGTYDNFKAYMWQCYAMFTNTNIGTSVYTNGQSSVYDYDYWAGYLVHKTAKNQYAYQTVTEATTGNGWNFDYIREVNIMLSHLDDGNLTDAEKKHWKAVGYFFHSYWYMELINRFGDVPWVVDVLDDTSEEAYGERDDRMAVADSVLARLQWAEENIGDFTEEDGDNTINQDVIRAALSRFTLREGTWRKYHDLGDYTKYFTECQRVSLLLMADYPTLYTGTDGQPAAGYGEMWTTEDLSEVDGVIFYKQYLENYLMSYFCHSEHTKSNPYALHQAMIDMYLCTDGQTISNSPLYEGDQDMYSTFRNRDPRLYHTVMPPYKVKSATDGDYATWSYATNTAYREYIDIMGVNSSCSNPGVGMKRLPAQNWSASLLTEAPNILGVSGSTYMSSYSGYFLWKNYDCWETNASAEELNTADKPIFKIEEVLLNYAEAMFELGSFNQSVADASINKLRERAGVADMTVSEIDADFDPNRDTGDSSIDGDYEVDPVLWEIRRERIIELMGEGFGFYDVRRWKKAHYFINRQPKGYWTKQSGAYKGLLNEQTHLADYSMTEGYAYLLPDPVNTSGAGWLEKYYLYQVPTNEIVLNPNLTQNPGW